MDQTLIDIGISQYESMRGADDVERDAEGFIILRPKADRVDQKLESLTTNIDLLESKLKELRETKAETAAYKDSDEYKAEKKEKKKGKKKKDRERLIQMVFNNADRDKEEDDSNSDGDDDSPKGDKSSKKGKGNKKASTTLDTTYGQRFSPIVSMLHDSINDFGRIAEEIEAELETPAGKQRTRYRSDQMGNLISAKNSQLSALKELGSIAKQLSDLEYRKDKEAKAEAGDTTKALSNLAAQYLRTTDDVGGKKKGKGKKESKKEKAKGNFTKSAKSMGYDVDDDDDDEDEAPSGKSKKNYELAQQFAKVLEKRGGELSFSPYEKHLDLEGHYKFMVVCDPLDPEHTWEFIAVDPDTGKEIKGFKKDYKDLVPKKSATKMRFDIQKKKCTDLNSSKNYRLVFTS